jgi:predicted peptidase
MVMYKRDTETRSGVKSPAMGLNDNIDFLGKELHVQTENVDATVPCILTQVFFRGRVIQTVKHEYPTEIRNHNNFSKIHDLMHTQHKDVMEKISRQQEKYRKQS